MIKAIKKVMAVKAAALREGDSPGNAQYLMQRAIGKELAKALRGGDKKAEAALRARIRKDPGWRDTFYDDPVVHVAAEFNLVRLAASLLRANQTHPETPNLKGNRPAHIAAAEGNTNFLRMLREEFDATFNTFNNKGKRRKKGKQGETPLDLAIRGGHKETAAYIESQGGVTGEKLSERLEKQKPEPRREG